MRTVGMGSKTKDSKEEAKLKMENEVLQGQVAELAKTNEDLIAKIAELKREIVKAKKSSKKVVEEQKPDAKAPDSETPELES